jgi:hypothetical protein
MTDSAFAAVLVALEKLAAHLENPYFRVDPPRSEEVADRMERLHTGLRQLNCQLNFDYSFDGSYPEDVIAYTRLLLAYKTPCAEKIGYLLDRPVLFGDDPYAIAQSEQLAELLQQIREDAERVPELKLS